MISAKNLILDYGNDNGMFEGMGDQTYFWTSVQGGMSLAYYNQLTRKIFLADFWS